MLLLGAPHNVDCASEPAQHVAGHRQLLRRSVPNVITHHRAAGRRHRRSQIQVFRHLKPTFDPPLVLRCDLQHVAFAPIVRAAKHEDGGVRREELLNSAVLLELLVLHQDVLHDGLQSVLLSNVVPLLLQGDPALLVGGHHKLPPRHGTSMDHDRSLTHSHTVPPAVVTFNRSRLPLKVAIVLLLPISVNEDALTLDSQYFCLDKMRPTHPDLASEQRLCNLSDIRPALWLQAEHHVLPPAALLKHANTCFLQPRRVPDVFQGGEAWEEDVQLDSLHQPLLQFGDWHVPLLPRHKPRQCMVALNSGEMGGGWIGAEIIRRVVDDKHWSVRVATSFVCSKLVLKRCSCIQQSLLVDEGDHHHRLPFLLLSIEVLLKLEGVVVDDGRLLAGHQPLEAGWQESLASSWQHC